MYRLALAVSIALIGLGFSTFAVAHPTDIKPVFADASANGLVAQRAIETDPIILTSAASDAVYSLPRHTSTSMNDPAPASKSESAPVMQSPPVAPPAASGFFTSIFNEVPQPGVLAMVALGAALCRFGSSFLGIRR